MVMRPALVNVLAKAAEQAGRKLVSDFARIDRIPVKQKGPADFVTMSDFKAQEIIREILSEERPNFGFLMEEEDGVVEKEAAKERFIVDPLDGTANFIHGIPHWAISMAVEREGEIVSGMIYNPIAGEMFWAEKGVGAYLGRNRIQVSGRSDLSECLLANTLLYRGNRKDTEKGVQCVGEMCKHTAGVRREGSATLDLAYVAAGRYDGYWVTSGVSIWDMAAGALIVKEAGGMVSPMVEGEDPIKSGALIATNSRIHNEVVAKLRSV